MIVLGFLLLSVAVFLGLCEISAAIHKVAGALIARERK